MLKYGIYKWLNNKLIIIRRHPVLAIGWLFISVFIYKMIGLIALFLLSFLFIIFIYFDDKNLKDDLNDILGYEFNVFMEKEFNHFYYEYHMEHGGDSPLEIDFIEFVEKVKKRTHEGKCIRGFHTLYRRLLDRIEVFPDFISVDKSENVKAYKHRP
jgi:hypothetical protein